MTDTESKAIPLPSVSVIVPTYQEAENIPELIARLAVVREEAGLDMEVLIMDDDSADGTEAAVRDQGKDWVRLMVRKENRGLSAAVLDGFEAACKEVLLVMDADLSHPPEKIPEMLTALAEGADFVLGSRYVEGAGTAEDWGLLRWINSKAATMMARPLTSLRDPMSGFFAFRRNTYAHSAPMNPIGYKIGLEVLVKCNCRNAVETPIYFSQRKHGESKLSLKEQLRYVQHLRRLFIFKYGNWAHFAHFAAVGFSGVFVNLAVLNLLNVGLSLPLRLSVALAILVSMFTNFLLNRRFTFSYARAGNWWRQLFGFMAASSVGACVNYATVLTLFFLWPVLEDLKEVAAIGGILAGMIFNFYASRYLVFKKPKDQGRQ